MKPRMPTDTEAAAAPRPVPPFDPLRAAQVASDVLAATGSSADALAERQRLRLAELIRVARQRSRYFAGTLGDEDPLRLRLEELPVTRKATLMHAFDEWVADPALDLAALRRFVADPSRIADPFAGRYVVWESSGTTGESGIFVQDAAAMAVYDALEGLRRPATNSRRWFDPWGLAERRVFVGALGGHFASNVSIERLRRLNPVLHQTITSLSFLMPTSELVARLQALRPTSIATYPTAAALLAGEQRAGRLNIAPQEILVGGETLSAAMREHVEETFGCPVIASYGASEFLSIATACAHGRLHLNSDWVIIEPIDAHGRPTPRGQSSQTALLTNLANHVQPLIRYDIGDSITVHPGHCPCGSALPTISVHGRDDAPLRLRAAGGRTITLLPLALTTILEEDGGLFDFQLVCHGPRRLVLGTTLEGRGADDALRRGRDALDAYLVAQGAVGVKIDCRSEITPLRGKSGKIPRIVEHDAAGSATSDQP